MAGKWDNFAMRSQSDVNLRPQKYLQKTYPPPPRATSVCVDVDK